MREPEFAPHFTGWHEPWEFASAEATAERLTRTGFIDVATSLEDAPIVQSDAGVYREFVASVVCRHHLAPLPPPLRDAFMDSITAQAAADSPPFELDYWRLNMSARKPDRASV